MHEPVDLKAERMKRQTSSESATSASASGRTAEEQEELEQLNAALLAAQVLALADAGLAQRLEAYRAERSAAVADFPSGAD